MYNAKSLLKRISSVVLTFILLLSILTGCKNSSDQVKSTAYVNSTYKDKGMLTIDKTDTGDKFPLYDHMHGMGLIVPEEFEQLAEKMKLNIMQEEDGIYIDYLKLSYDELSSKAEKDGSSEEELMKLIRDNSLPLVALLAYPEADASSVNSETLKKKKELYEKVEQISAANGYTYYLAYTDDFSTVKIEDFDKSDLDLITKSINKLKNNIILFPQTELPQNTNDNAGSKIDAKFNDFSASTLKGETITPDIFSTYEITMINIWATWCGPCVEEMPELQKVYEQLPESTNMITLCSDATTEKDLANEILSSAKAEFTTIIPDEKLNELINKHITAFPTTLFVDKDGNVIGEAMLGAPAIGAGIVENYLTAINDRVQMVKDNA